MKIRSLVSLSLALLLAACGKSPSPQPVQPAATSSPQAAPAAVDRNTLGVIVGNISFKGVVPKLPSLDMGIDPACPAEPQPQDTIMAKNGRLANVFVYVKSGLSQTSFAAPSEPVVLDQRACRYIPHVLGLMAGQLLKVLNDDNAQHNVHPMPKDNSEWNESQLPRGDPILKTFQHPELMIPVQCNQHPWMKMYVNVMAHPFFTVSSEDGSFQIKDLPAGTYTLAAIHEKFGEQTMSVTIAPKQTVNANFVFTAGSK